MAVGLGNVRIKGLSGRMYTFRAYPLNTTFAKVGAVYCITSRNQQPDGRISHSRICCGETDNLSSRSDTHEREDSLKANHANCICILPNMDEETRVEIESDIHRKYKFLF